MRQLTVYMRAGCGLCEEMVGELVLLKDQFDFELRTEDVDRSVALVERYGQRVPVLVGESGELCHYFLDRDAVLRYLSGP